MVVAKHLPPIQPYPAQHDTPVHIAPSDSNGNGLGFDPSRKRQSGSCKGLVIRTSKHWVLPPRPKPGRKPSERRRTTSAGASNLSTPTPAPSVPQSAPTASAPTTTTTAPISSVPSPTACVPPGTPVSPGTSWMKKDLSKLPIKNINHSSKVHQASANAGSSAGCISSNNNSNNNSHSTLTPCVSPSPPKRTKTSLKKEIQHIKSENTKLKQELGLLVGNLQDLKQKCKQVEAQGEKPDTTTTIKSENDSGSRKRPLDESLAFLKFEEDEETLPPLLTANRMNPSSSVSSRTNLTDDEDLLTVSSSTPNSLFSLDLQQSQSSSLCSRSHSKSSPLNEKSQFRFLDSFEQLEFNEKHAEKLMTNNPMTTTTSASNIIPSVELPLSSIKEEETDQFPFMDPTSEEASILDFLQAHQDVSTDPINDPKFFNDINGTSNNNIDGATNNDNNNNNPENDDLFQNLSLAAPSAAAATNASACYVPPSLEELMEEQDGGFVGNSNANATLTNVNDYDDDFDMLKTQVFDMA